VTHHASHRPAPIQNPKNINERANAFTNSSITLSLSMIQSLARWVPMFQFYPLDP